MQQTITWANVDQNLCLHVASLGHTELTDLTAKFRAVLT